MGQQTNEKGAPLDVLAVLDYCISAVDGWSAAPKAAPSLREARAAVVDLANAAADAAELLESVAPYHPQAANLLAALARCRGGES